MMPSARPFVGTEEARAVNEVLQSGWLGCGPKTAEFEEAVRQFIGCGAVVAVNSGTAALHLSLAALGIGSGDEVLVPSLTFCASVQAILACGATPVFVDVDPETLCANPVDIGQRITKRTRAILPVHYGGHPCPMNEILHLASNYGIFVVEDAAHAFGSMYLDQKVGTIGTTTCFSFDPIKNITCGEGGAITLNSAALAEKLRNMRTLGMTADGYDRHRRNRGEYEVNHLGYRYHMSDINAAIGLEQLRKFPMIAERRRRIASLYEDLLSGIQGVTCLHRNLQTEVPFNFVVRVDEHRRDGLLSHLRAHDISTGVHYPPNHLQPLFRPYRTALPLTERICREIMTLPLYPAMSDRDVQQVVDTMHTGLSLVAA